MGIAAEKPCGNQSVKQFFSAEFFLMQLPFSHLFLYFLDLGKLQYHTNTSNKSHVPTITRHMTGASSLASTQRRLVWHAL